MGNYYHTDIANISRSKGNQAIKVGQLIEYNMRRIVLRKIFFSAIFSLYSRPWYFREACGPFQKD